MLEKYSMNTFHIGLVKCDSIAIFYTFKICVNVIVRVLGVKSSSVMKDGKSIACCHDTFDDTS